MNTFIVVSDYGNDMITVQKIENFLAEAFKYAQKNYTGWPRGFQSGLGVIAVSISNNIDQDAIRYCKELKSGKKWAAFMIPVAVCSSMNQIYCFEKNPTWGAFYFPYFKKIISDLALLNV